MPTLSMPTHHPNAQSTSNPQLHHEIEVLSDHAIQISQFPLVIKRSVNRPHSSVAAIIALERANESSDSKGQLQNPPFLENMSYGQLQALSTVPSDSPALDQDRGLLFSSSSCCILSVTERGTPDPCMSGDEELVLQQLKCCGVLEVVRISRAGFPTRMTHQEFATRYGFLLSEANASQDPLSISVAVLQQFNIPPEMYQVGYTKLYLRTGQIGALEDKRKQVLQGILGIQKCFRGYQAKFYIWTSSGQVLLGSPARLQCFQRK